MNLDQLPNRRLRKWGDPTSSTPKNHSFFEDPQLAPVEGLGIRETLKTRTLFMVLGGPFKNSTACNRIPGTEDLWDSTTTAVAIDP